MTRTREAIIHSNIMHAERMDKLFKPIYAADIQQTLWTTDLLAKLYIRGVISLCTRHVLRRWIAYSRYDLGGEPAFVYCSPAYCPGYKECYRDAL